jgi:hypothetical protein
VSATGRHLDEGEIVDLLDGIGDSERRAHAGACLDCSRRLEEAGRAMRLAHEAEVPEPSPLYWEAFRRQVGQRIETDARPMVRRSRLGIGLLAAAGLVGLIVLSPPVRFGHFPPPRAAVLPPWSAFPDAGEDDGLSVLQEMADGQDVALGSECAIEECLVGLSDEETSDLAHALRALARERS